jgi:hypothetical protein
MLGTRSLTQGDTTEMIMLEWTLPVGADDTSQNASIQTGIAFSPSVPNKKTSKERKHQTCCDL